MSINRDIYIKARALITDERYWCKGNYVNFEAIDGVIYRQHCLVGAIAVNVGLASEQDSGAYGLFEQDVDKGDFPELLAAMERLYPSYQLNADGLLEFNDFEGYAAVLAVLDEAIRNS